MLLTVEETIKKIQEGLLLSLAGDENVLRALPAGQWIGGTIPYFMDSAGGTISKEKIYVDVIPDFGGNVVIKSYDVADLRGIPTDAPENGFSLIIIPATSDAHLTFAQNAPNFKDIFMKPLIGWISGVHLDDLGKISPKVFNGAQSEETDKKAVEACPTQGILVINLGILDPAPRCQKPCFLHGILWPRCRKHCFLQGILQPRCQQHVFYTDFCSQNVKNLVFHKMFRRSPAAVPSRIDMGVSSLHRRLSEKGGGS